MEDDLLDIEAELGRLPTPEELIQRRARSGNYSPNGHDRDQAWYELRTAQEYRRSRPLAPSEAAERLRHARERRGASGW